ncbi:MAG TPA: hypothetical protein VGG39_27390 [Polyangiaceae bacterium]|jgi:hypothetical protein
MRPSIVLGFVAAVAAAVTFDVAASADGSPPAPTIAVSSGSITVTANGGAHINPGFPWYFKDGTGTKVKKVADFSFPGADAAKTRADAATVSGVPASGTLRGAYCTTDATGNGSCYTFTAACTATACSITGI